MDPGTALAVVSLAIQLAGTIQSVNEFIHTIRDAPSELVALVETLEQMQSNLNQVRHLLEQFSDARLAGSLVSILNALRACGRRVKILGDTVDDFKGSLNNERIIKRTWANLKVRNKMIKVQKLQSQLREAMSNLHLAMTNNMMQLQMHRIQMANSQYTTILNQLCSLKSTVPAVPSIMPWSAVEVTQMDEEQSDGEQSDGEQSDGEQNDEVQNAVSRPVLSLSTRQTSTIWYRGFLGLFETQMKLQSVKSSPSRSIKKHEMIKKAIVIRAWLVKLQLEIYFGASFASIPRALRVYQVVADFGWHIRAVFQNGNLEGLQAAITNGTISPFVVDWSGQMPFGFNNDRMAARHSMPKACALLVKMGVDPNRVSYSETAMMSTIFYNRRFWDTSCVVDTMRAILPVQEDVSRAQISQTLIGFHGAPDVLEFILSWEMVQWELKAHGSEDIIYPPLATALREYGFCFFDDEPELAKLWESFIRSLLQTGVDIHAPVPRGRCFYPRDYPCILGPYGTPLDELFTDDKRPFEGKLAADAWLQILSSEGYDTLAYLEREKALHDTQPPLTLNQTCGHNYTLRQLVFNLGQMPNVYADRWVNPQSSAYLVRQEFKDMNAFSEYHWFEDEEQCWPYYYRAGHPLDNYHNRISPLRQRIEERAERRWHKQAEKAGHLDSTRLHPAMPGAWFE